MIVWHECPVTCWLANDVVESPQQPVMSRCYWQMELMTLTFTTVKCWSSKLWFLVHMVQHSSWQSQFLSTIFSYCRCLFLLSRVTGFWSGSTIMSPADFKIWEAMFVFVLNWTFVRPDPQKCSIFWILSCGGNHMFRDSCSGKWKGKQNKAKVIWTFEFN